MNAVKLRIGITGHRDLDAADADGLRDAVMTFLVDLAERLPGIELELITGLADGADRVAFDAALAAGIGVHALLPMPLDLYVADFDAASRADLQARLDDPRVRSTALPLPPGVTPAAAAQPGPERDALYVALAERLRQDTALLLALWDGEDTGLPGGTADTVLRHLGIVAGEGRREPRDYFLNAATEDERVRVDRPVYRFPAARRCTGRGLQGAAGYLGVTTAGEVVLLGPGLPRAIAGEVDELVDYARQAAAHVDPAAHPWGLMTDEVRALRPDAVLELAALDLEFRRADLLAIHHQRRSELLFRAFSLMAAAMGFLFLYYAKLGTDRALLTIYLALFLCGFVLHSLAARHHWFTRHLMCRAIAETLRTRFFLSVAGVPARGLEQHLMRLLGIRRIEGFGWIDYVIRGVTPLVVGASANPAGCIDYVRRHWIEDQRRYFQRKGDVLRESGERLGRIKSSILLGMLLGIAMLLAFKQELVERHLGAHTLKDYLIFLLGLVPFWLGVWELYQMKMATKELGWQYRNQHAQLDEAAMTLRQATTPERAGAVLARTAEGLLADTYLWTVQRFHREHEPPAAG